ncbi:MAG: hypothetical protein V4819_12280 [Verrucomicrobiota bacterium]
MIRHLAISWISGVMALVAAESSDLLRFTNGDQLHGSFQGLKDGPRAIWQRDDVAAPVEFETEQLRHIVLHGGKPLRPLASLSHLALVNGDSIPGTVTDLDDDAVTIDTSYAGPLRFPRNQVARLSPSPLGGRLHYHGPFIEDEWKMANAAFPDGMPPAKPDAVEKDKGDKEQPGRWAFSGSAWYWPSRLSGTALLKENAMPDRSILRFDLAWKNRLSIAIGFHADFAKPKPPENADKPAEKIQMRRPLGFAPGDSTILPVVFGNSYVLQIFSTHMMLFRTSVNEDGGPVVDRVQINGNSIRLGDTGKATIEIRSNRLTGEISLFINDEFVVQWNEGVTGIRDQARFAGKGSGFGFVVQIEDSPVKISDVMVAEWNGMPDSARSLQVDDQDIVLLANGTDRFSGRVAAFRDGKLTLDGKYGKFQFQLDDIAEIRFARNRLAKETDFSPDNLTVRLSPLGQVSGRPLSGNASSIRILNPVSGEMNLNLDSAVMLDFQPSNNIIDDWDAEF